MDNISIKKKVRGGKVFSSFIILLLFFFIDSHAQTDSVIVKFILTSASLSADSSVYITGNIPQLGNWHPGKINMDYIGNSRWSKKIILDKPQSIEYKYTLGSWEAENADSNGLPLKNFNLEITDDTVISNDVFFWTTPKSKKEITSTITGTVKYHYNIRSDSLADRDIIVWLPPEYETGSENYPVLYMHDGQNIFDAATSAFGTEWRVDETIDSLIRINEIPPLIVVGIYNTVNRTSEYTPGDTSSAYMGFIVNKLKAFIDSTYRTLPGREHTFTGGSSAGGLISFMLVWEYPDVFSKAICMSPALKISFIDYVSVVDSSESRDDIFFYIDNGGLGVEEKLQPGIDEMIAELKEKGFTEGEDYVYSIYSQDEHFESAWSKRFPGAVQYLFQSK